MKILMLCPQFRPLTGGYERAAERLAITLVARGHAVTVITERRDPAWPAHDDLQGVQLRRLWCVFRRGLHASTSLFSFTVWLMVHGRQFDVWHVHQYGAHATLAVGLGKLLRRPVVLKLTSSGVQGVAAALQGLRCSRAHRWAHRQVAACIAVSAETVREARAFGIPPTRIHAIGNGVDTRVLRPATAEVQQQARRQRGLGAGLVALAVGRLAVEKNPLGMLQAWAWALPRLPSGARLVWVGDGPLRSAVEAGVEQMGLGQSVLLVGHAEDVPMWLAAADLFVLSSHNEGMANTLLEAMACGLPSVATAVSGVPQLLSESGAGRVVPIGDMAALADAIVDLATDAAARAHMGDQARATIAADYAIDVVVERMLAVYAEVSAHG